MDLHFSLKPHHENALINALEASGLGCQNMMAHPRLELVAATQARREVVRSQLSAFRGATWSRADCGQRLGHLDEPKRSQDCGHYANLTDLAAFMLKPLMDLTFTALSYSPTVGYLRTPNTLGP
jgi:hypothetical protein